MQTANFSKAKDFTNKPSKPDPYMTRKIEVAVPQLGEQPRNYLKPEKVKFSSVGENKEYFINTDTLNGLDRSKLKDFEPTEKQTRIPFDPNVRHRLPKVDNKMMYMFRYGHMPT